MIANGFKKLLALGLTSGYKFKQLEAAQNAKSCATTGNAAGNAGPGKTVTKVVEKEPSEEEADVSMGGMFSD